MQKPFLTAEWNNLIMANYHIDPNILLPYLPANTELDFYNGKCYVSFIGFMFQKVKLLGIPVPFHTNFEEVNLRFYVRHFNNGQWKRGAVFIKEIVPKPAISFVANTLYKEKYVTKRMKHFFNQSESKINLGYQFKHHGKWQVIEAITSSQALPITEGSEEQFIAEHYWGYSKYNATTTFEYQVQHPSWKVHKVIDYNINCDFTSVYGTPFSFLSNTNPQSVFMAKGSPIAIFNKRRL